MSNSKFATINWADFLKGIVVFALFSLLSSITPILEAGALPTAAQWVGIGASSLNAIIAYIAKQFFTNSDGKLFKAEPKA